MAFELVDLQKILADPVVRLYDDVNILALTMFGEGRGESLDGRVAIAWTAYNRSLTRGRSVTDRCLQRLQYSCWWIQGGQANYRRLLDLAEKVFIGQPLGTDTGVFGECLYLAQGVLDMKLRDKTGGSTHYMTTALYRLDTVKWAKGRQPTAVIGSHSFFANIPWS